MKISNKKEGGFFSFKGSDRGGGVEEGGGEENKNKYFIKYDADSFTQRVSNFILLIIQNKMQLTQFLKGPFYIVNVAIAP